jgi:hypothetical protein
MPNLIKTTASGAHPGHGRRVNVWLATEGGRAAREAG